MSFKVLVVSQIGIFGFSNYKNSVTAVSVESVPFIVTSVTALKEAMKDKPLPHMFASFIIIVTLLGLTAGNYTNKIKEYYLL